MGTNAIQQRPAAATLEQVLVGGDLGRLTPEQRVEYYNLVCSSVGLNPLTRPFDYINLSGKLTLYAKRDCTDQLRKIHGVSVTITARDMSEGVYVVTARATDKDGRTDESTGAVAVGNLKGEALANALMKAETKAKRRVTLSICGLGMLDETEVETVPGAVAHNEQGGRRRVKAEVVDADAPVAAVPTLPPGLSPDAELDAAKAELSDVVEKWGGSQTKAAVRSDFWAVVKRCGYSKANPPTAADYRKMAQRCRQVWEAGLGFALWTSGQEPEDKPAWRRGSDSRKCLEALVQAWAHADTDDQTEADIDRLHKASGYARKDGVVWGLLLDQAAAAHEENQELTFEEYVDLVARRRAETVARTQGAAGVRAALADNPQAQAAPVVEPGAKRNGTKAHIYEPT